MQLFMDAKLDLTYMFNIIGSNQAVEINEFSLILSFLIAWVNLGLQILILQTNIDNVNYKQDIKTLRRSCKLTENHAKASIFLLKGRDELQITNHFFQFRDKGPTLDSENAWLIPNPCEDYSFNSDNTEEAEPELFRESYNNIWRLNSLAEKTKSYSR